MLVGTVDLPPHDQVLAIGGDRAIVLHRSALDVETLVVYTLDVLGEVAG